MRIVRASVLEFRRMLDGRSWNPTMRWTERRAPLLVLEADDGSTGIGEAWSRQSEITRVLECLTAVARVIVGGDTDDAPIVVPEARKQGWVAPATASAVDMALFDLRAQQAGLPLWRFLAPGPARDGRVAVYASAGLYRDGTSDADLAREMRGHIDAGFAAVKMKVGAIPLAEDLRRVHAVREAIGSASLWIDAVNQLPPDSAVTAVRTFARAGADAIQAPVSFDDLTTMARINRHVLPVIAAEGEFQRAKFEALVDSRAVGCLQFCLGLVGGFSGGAALAQMATAHGLWSTPQCFSTAIMQAASLHFGAATPDVVTVEYHRFHDHLAALLPDSMQSIVDGHVVLAETPGLGLRAIEPGPQPDGGEIVQFSDIH